MELRRVADTLLRCQTSPLASLLNPSATRWQAGKQLSHKSIIAGGSRSSFTTSASRSARPGSSQTTSAGPSPSTLSFNDTKQSTTPGQQVDQIAQNLGWTQTNRTPWFNPDTLNRSGTSSDALLASLNSLSRSKQGTFKSSMDGMKTGRESLLDMAVGPMQVVRKEREPRIRKLKPSSGREVLVGGAGPDVGRAFRLMEMSCARNRVRSDFTKQRFHEREGLKRKRLVRQRWRKQFMDSFKQTVAKVKRLHAQGW